MTLNPFTVLQVDPGPYVDTCLYVYCSLGANEKEAAVCDTLASYVRECAQQHVILSWRGPGLCGMSLISLADVVTNAHLIQQISISRRNRVSDLLTVQSWFYLQIMSF